MHIYMFTYAYIDSHHSDIGNTELRIGVGNHGHIGVPRVAWRLSSLSKAEHSDAPATSMDSG